MHVLYIGCTSQRRNSGSYVISFYFSGGAGGEDVTLPLLYSLYVFSSRIRRFPDDSVLLWQFALKTRNTESGLYASFGDLAQHSSFK